MHRIFNHLEYIFFIFLIFGCDNSDNKEKYPLPFEPEPTFEFNTNKQEIVLRRDTADYAHLNFHFCLPQKIDGIEIYSQNSSQPIERLNEYKGQCAIDFDYAVDITDILTDTTLSYSVKVIDSNQKLYMKDFQFNIKPFSTPQIILPDGLNLITDLNKYKIRATFTTGSIPIFKIKVNLDGKDIDIDEPKKNSTSYTLEAAFTLNYLKEYPIILQVEDINGRQSTRHLKITKVALMEKPTTVIFGENDKYRMNLQYNERSGEIEKIDVANYFYFTFERKDDKTNGLITCIHQIDYRDPKKSTDYIYTYNNQNMLHSIDEVCNGTKTIQIEKCNYTSNNLISYNTDDLYIGNITQENLKTLGIVQTEVWNAPFSKVTDSERLKAVEFWTLKLPTFINDIPNSMFYPYEIGNEFQDIFLSKYVHLKNVSQKDSCKIIDEYKYETDSKGRISTLTKTSNSNKTHQYKFIYTDTL